MRKIEIFDDLRSPMAEDIQIWTGPNFPVNASIGFVASTGLGLEIGKNCMNQNQATI